MTGFSLSAFRDFCAAKPEGEEYDAELWSRYAEVTGFLVPADAWQAIVARPRTYGALTARLDALIEGEKK